MTAEHEFLAVVTGVFALLILVNLVHLGAHRNCRKGARFVYVHTLTGTRKSALIGFGVASIAGFIGSLFAIGRPVPFLGFA